MSTFSTNTAFIVLKHIFNVNTTLICTHTLHAFTAFKQIHCALLIPDFTIAKHRVNRLIREALHVLALKKDFIVGSTFTENTALKGNMHHHNNVNAPIKLITVESQEAVSIIL